MTGVVDQADVCGYQIRQELETEGTNGSAVLAASRCCGRWEPWTGRESISGHNKRRQCFNGKDSPCKQAETEWHKRGRQSGINGKDSACS